MLLNDSLAFCGVFVRTQLGIIRDIVAFNEAIVAVRGVFVTTQLGIITNLVAFE